ncbi:hypothetical protein NF552_24665 (plasmid) [Roseomonas mucosa]|nr:hypothetical protein NF552_24665 [Roseomonas mucosa]
MADNQRQAERAQQAGRSFTPPINASQRGIPPDLQLPPPVQLPAAIATPAPAAPVVSPPAVRPATVEAPPPALLYAPPPMRATPSPNPIRTVAQTNTPTTPADDPAFRAAVNGLFGGWQGRPGQTTVTLAPSAAAEDGRDGAGAFARPASAGRVTRPATTETDGALPGGSVRQGRVLMPAGRGLYAHTVLAVSSETGGPIVLQADSGPIAGARLIGSFNRAGQSNRLVVRVTRVQYQGQTIQADGIVVAPNSMETAVATNVDQRMLERFVLPAAAAFIAGLGQAVATTSNTYGQLNPWVAPPSSPASTRSSSSRSVPASPRSRLAGHWNRRRRAARPSISPPMHRSGSCSYRICAPPTDAWPVAFPGAVRVGVDDPAGQRPAGSSHGHPPRRASRFPAADRGRAGPGGPVEPRCAAGASAAA